jgi:acyl-coenzyme A synthetase/AMP-(fatty) acid ligase
MNERRGISADMVARLRQWSVESYCAMTGPIRSGVVQAMANNERSIIERLERAADGAAGVYFAGASLRTDDDTNYVGWRQIHDEALAIAAALQARGVAPGDHVAILGPTSRNLMTVVRACWFCPSRCEWGRSKRSSNRRGCGFATARPVCC